MDPNKDEVELSYISLGFFISILFGIIGIFLMYYINVRKKNDSNKVKFLLTCLVGLGIHYVALKIPV